MPPSRDVLYSSNSSGRGTTGGRSAPTTRDGADRRVREWTGIDILLSDTGGAGGGTLVVATADEGCVEMITVEGVIASSTAPRFLGTAPSDPEGGGGGGILGREVDPARERLTSRLELRVPALCSSRVGEML